MKRFFILMAILLLSPSGIIATEVSAQTNEKRIYSCAFDGFVNMREEPSFSAKKVGKFNNGPEGAVLLEHLGEWVKIDASGTIGYVPTKYTQETPTIAYTGDVSVDWIEGIWKQGGTSLKIYNNGTWEKGYDFEQARGKYILQNNEIKFMTTRSHDEMAFNEVLPINREENRLGDYERGDFLTPEEYEEMSEEDGYDYGSVSKEEFRAAGKQLLEEIESQTDKPQEHQAENVVSKNTETNEDVQDLASIDVAEEIKYAKTPFFESDTFRWLIKGLLAVLAILLVIWLAKLIKKWYLKLKDIIAAKAQEAKVKAIELGGKAKERATELGGIAKEKAIELGGKAKEMATEFGDTGAEKASVALGKLLKATNETITETKGRIKNMKSSYGEKEEERNTSKSKKKNTLWYALAIIVVVIYVIARNCSGGDSGNYGGYDDYDYSDTSQTTNGNYRWIEGTWYSYVGGNTIVYKFVAQGDTYGTYTIGSSFSNHLEIGNWSISGDRVRLWDAATQITSNLYIEGKTLKDSDGSVLAKK